MDVSCIASNLCSTEVYFDFKLLTIIKQLTEFLLSARPFFIFIFFVWRFGLYFGHGFSFHEASRSRSDATHFVGSSGRVIRLWYLHLTTYNIHKIKTSMPSVGFEPNPRKRTDADPHLRQPGQRCWLLIYILTLSGDTQHNVVTGKT